MYFPSINLSLAKFFVFGVSEFLFSILAFVFSSIGQIFDYISTNHTSQIVGLAIICVIIINNWFEAGTGAYGRMVKSVYKITKRRFSWSFEIFSQNNVDQTTEEE